MNIYDYSVTAPDGTQVSLSDFKGKVMLIVNTATGCGFTPLISPAISSRGRLPVQTRRYISSAH